MNSIVGFNPPRRGKIVFKGDDITGKPSFETVRSGMGLVPQGRRVFPTLGVEENLLVAERSPDRHGWNLERVYKLFPRLHERRNQRAKTLSGGEQQMLAIGRALMTNPDCLIMDEPSEGLAPIIIQGLWEAIGKLKEEGMSILLGRAERAPRAQAGRLRARDEQGPGGLFGQARKSSGPTTRSSRAISASDRSRRAATLSRNRALQTGIHWPMMALVRSVALATAARKVAL